MLPKLLSERKMAVSLMASLTVTDNGKGYPPEVLAALYSDETPDNAPHILGLHVVEQIATAHGVKTLFYQNVPAGAKAVVWLPVG